MAKTTTVTTVPLMKLQVKTSFTKDGKEYSLNDPEGTASEKQVMILYRRGRLAIVDSPVDVFTKGEASFALDATK